MGGGGGNTANTVSEFKPPEWLVPSWQQYVTGVTQAAAKPYTPFDGMKIAPFNGYQTAGMNMVEDLAMNSSPDVRSARGLNTDTTNGMYLMAGPQANVTPGVNKFAGQNSYLNDMIGQTAENMTTQMANGTMAQTDAAMARDGAFGGSAYNQMQTANAAALAKQLREMETGYRMQDYTTQQGLEEAALGRSMQAQQFNAADASNNWQQERARQMQAAGMAPAFANEDWKAANALTGVGDAYRQYMQELINQQVGDYTTAQQYPLQMLDLLGNAVSKASGGFGQSTASTYTPYNVSPVTGLLGLGSMAYGMSR